jgi:predicted lactoylglutathione lyase
MPKRIFVNLPVADVAKSTVFYEAIGFTKDARFSGDHASAMQWSDEISFMLLDRAFYSTFTPKQIVDTQVSTAALFALSFDGRAEVDAFTEKAIAAGAREGHEPEDMGFMYSRAFEDLDGHGFGPFWMDVEAAVAAMPSQGEPVTA